MSKILKTIIFIYIFFVNNTYSAALIDNEWLKDKLCKEGFVILEVHRSKKEYGLSHIPCSIYTNFYMDGWRETRNKIPLLMPKTSNLEILIGSLGISNNDHIIVVAPGTGKYDAAETAAIYFTFKYLGHTKISILNGGFKGWSKDWDSETETGYNKPILKSYKATINSNLLANKDDVLALLDKDGYLIDARPSDMFFGINRSLPALRSGTIPKSINIPNIWLLKNNTLYFHDKENLEKIIKYAGASEKNGQISFCNAGLESALTWFVMSEILGYPNNRLYESSLAEWSGNYSLPMINKINLNKDEKESKSFSMKPPNK